MSSRKTFNEDEKLLIDKYEYQILQWRNYTLGEPLGNNKLKTKESN